MDPSSGLVDAVAVAALVEADLALAALDRGLGAVRASVALTGGTWPIVVTVSSASHAEELSLAIEEEPFDSSEPSEHAEAAINLVCALLSERRALKEPPAIPARRGR